MTQISTKKKRHIWLVYYYYVVLCFMFEAKTIKNMLSKQDHYPSNRSSVEEGY